MIIYTVASPYIAEEYLISDDYMVSSVKGFYNFILRRIKSRIKIVFGYIRITV